MKFSVGAIAWKPSLLLLSTAVSHVNAFQSVHYSASLSTLLASNTPFGTGAARFGFGFRRQASAALRSTAEIQEPEIDTSAGWESLAAEIASLDESPAPTPVLTLYRDTNGWCPFCERVWICIRAKDLPYQERLIALFNKPEWYKEMVPTTQVPAVLFHEWDGSSDANSRKLVWESLDIMQALDDAFPNTVKLVHDTPEYKAAQEQNAQLGKAGFAFIYSRNENGDDEEATELDPEEEKRNKRNAFFSALDDLDRSLEESGGPFRIGSEFSGVDAEMIPTLERWRYQLPLKADDPIDILENRPSLKKWFDAMDAYTPYSDRARGDEYSWVAANAMFATFFGGSEETIKISNDAAAVLVEGFKPEPGSAFECEEKFAIEAAKKIAGNHENIAKDCTNPEPKSQMNIKRSQDESNADHLLQFVVEILMKGDGAIESASSLALSPALADLDDEKKKDAALSATVIASRLCVPRDMSAPAAKILRAVLMIVSERLSE